MEVLEGRPILANRRMKEKVLEGNPVLDGDAVPGKRSDSFTSATRWLVTITLTT
jgi:hypothetical protein